MLATGSRIPGRRRPSQVLLQNSIQSPQSHSRQIVRAASVSPTNSPPAGGATPTVPTTISGLAACAATAQVTGVSTVPTPTCGGASSEDSAAGTFMRRSSTTNSLHSSTHDRPRRRSKSNGGRDAKAATDAILAEAAARSSKGSPPKAFRVLPGRFSAPPTPRRQTPRAPKRTPRLSPRCTLITSSGIGSRLHGDHQEDRRRRRATALSVAAVAEVAAVSSTLQRSSSEYLPADVAGGESQLLPSGYPVIQPPTSSVNLQLGEGDHQGVQPSHMSLSGTTTPTEGGADASSVSMVTRQRGSNGAQAPDSRIMRLIGKRSVLRTSNGAPGPEVGRQRGKQQRWPPTITAGAVPQAGREGSPKALQSSLGISSPASGSRPARRAGQPSFSASAAPISCYTEPAGGDEAVAGSSIAELSTEIPSPSVANDRARRDVLADACSFTTAPAPSGPGVSPPAKQQDASLAARASAAVAEAAAAAEREFANGSLKAKPDEVQDGSAIIIDSRGCPGNQVSSLLVSRASGEEELKRSEDAAHEPEAAQLTSSSQSGAAEAIIWPGTGVQVEVKGSDQAVPVSVVSGDDLPDNGSGVPVYTPASAGGSQGPPGYPVELPWPLPFDVLLQNEAGSLVVPQTWRYVPPPPEQAPQPPQIAPTREVQPVESDEAATCRSAVADGVATVNAAAQDKAGDRSTGEEEVEEVHAHLDLEEKQQLVDDLVKYLIGRADRCEKELAAEQRSNRALRMSLEVETRKVALLQQQLYVVAAQANLQLPAATEDGSAAAAMGLLPGGAAAAAGPAQKDFAEHVSSDHVPPQ
eukprot:TRINITY_DN13235_c0_g1_i1.p1 TRINITY_DN13235_c0_g1~~TRINITY_DN13235_c0_g1_i1.p1  ORF type:complete len:809 (+),score=181.58 TRINITY_DN13235_c0_g1_i1:149-2575(+)